MNKLSRLAKRLGIPIRDRKLTAKELEVLKLRLKKELEDRKKNPKGLIPLKGISVKGRTVTFVGNPGTLSKYKKKLTALAKRLVR